MFNVFGYEHPPERVIAFLKYIPARFKALFAVDFLGRTWTFEKVKLFRAEKLYTAQNYQTFIETFRKSFPRYVHFCPFRQKEVISTPLDAVKKVFVPKECLRSLTKSERLDKLQEKTLDFMALVSSESNIPMQDFGVHGSVALGMHSSKSDIDVVVYGSSNFRKMEATINQLVKGGKLSYMFNNRLDAARRFKGRFSGKIFMYNAIRKPEEHTSEYGTFKYTPISPVKFRCAVSDDAEAMFRPAIYRIDGYKPLNQASTLGNEKVPNLVVSMIGCYRNVARQGSIIEVSGTLERVDNLRTGEQFHQAVVGTGTSEEEYIWPL